MTETPELPDPEIDLDLLDAMTPPLTELDNDPRIPFIVENLRHIYDPEIPVNIYELGLIYESKGDYENAEYYYKEAQSMENKEYRNSIRPIINNSKIHISICIKI